MTDTPRRKIGRPRTRPDSESRTEYARRYYQEHKDKAKEYQLQYNHAHRKTAKTGRQRAPMIREREAVKTAYHRADLAHLPPEKFIKVYGKIIAEEVVLTA